MSESTRALVAKHRAEVLRLLETESEFTGCRELWRKYGRWGWQTMKRRLEELVAEGLVEKRTVESPHGHKPRAVYRLIRKDEAA